jgi:hypothetical protein
MVPPGIKRMIQSYSPQDLTPQGCILVIYALVGTTGMGQGEHFDIGLAWTAHDVKEKRG